MRLEKRIEGDVILLPLEGKLMGGSETAILSNQLQQLIERGYNKIVLDFEQVKWINSPGIGLLIKWLRILRENGGDLRFTNTGDKVRYYLKITKLMTVIKTFENPQDAVNSFLVPLSFADCNDGNCFSQTSLNLDRTRRLISS